MQYIYIYLNWTYFAIKYSLDVNFLSPMNTRINFLTLQNGLIGGNDKSNLNACTFYFINMVAILSDKRPFLCTMQSFVYHI